jgi:glucose dehydrogenase
MRLATVLCAALLTSFLAAPSLGATDVSLDPEAIGKAPIGDWTTFNGDYSGQRYSTLTQITPANVNQIAQQWVYKISGVGGQRGASQPVIKCTPLLVNGVLYITIPDHLFALNARSGQ